MRKPFPSPGAREASASVTGVVVGQLAIECELSVRFRGRMTLLTKTRMPTVGAALEPMGAGPPLL
jgi:hypothetical protein